VKDTAAETVSSPVTVSLVIRTHSFGTNALLGYDLLLEEHNLMLLVGDLGTVERLVVRQRVGLAYRFWSS
jgi:hypothetical protein